MQRPRQTARHRVCLGQLAPPRGLGVLLVIVVVVGLSWALLVPPFQSPDELAHFGYAQSLAERFAIPGDPRRPAESSDESLAEDAVGAAESRFTPDAAPPDWSRPDFAAYLARQRAHPPSKSNGSGASTAEQNPPLYYLFAAVGYLIDHDGTAFGRLYAMRILGVLLLALTTIAAWLLAGETLGRRRLPQLACAAVAGLLPEATFMSVAVNPDALLMTTWTFAFWLGARVINRRAQGRDAVALCAVTAAAILTKAPSYALVAPVLLALLVGWMRRPSGERRHVLAVIAGAGLVLLAPVLGWLALARSIGRSGINTIGTTATHPFKVTQFLSYVWQFYLPRLPFLTTFRTTPQAAVYDIWIRQLTGAFGWGAVALPSWLYAVAAAAAGAIAAGAVVLVSRLRERPQLALLGFFALALLALLVLLHVTAYRVIISSNGQFLQGRYLLPAVGLIGLAVGLIVARFPPAGRGIACGVAIIALLAVQAIALATIAHTYYV